MIKNLKKAYISLKSLKNCEKSHTLSLSSSSSSRILANSLISTLWSEFICHQTGIFLIFDEINLFQSVSFALVRLRNIVPTASRFHVLFSGTISSKSVRLKVKVIGWWAWIPKAVRKTVLFVKLTTSFSTLRQPFYKNFKGFLRNS